MTSRRRGDWATPRWGYSWLCLCGALLVHVIDEAATDFLAIWNPWVESLRETIPWLPLPTFRFEIWLGLLLLAVVVLAALSPHAFRGAWGMRPLSYAFGVVMLGNGIGHIALSLMQWRPLPGVISSPLLLAASIWLILSIPAKEPGRRHG